MNSSVHGEDVDALADFPAADVSALQDLRKSGLNGAPLEDALDQILVEYVKNSDVWKAEAVGMETAMVSLGGVVPLWLWVNSCIRLQELFLDYELI